MSWTFDKMRNANWLQRKIMKKVVKLNADHLIAYGGKIIDGANGFALRGLIEQLEGLRCPYMLMAKPGQGYIVKVLPPKARDRLPNTETNIRVTAEGNWA